MKKLCNDSGFSRTEDIKRALLHELDDYDAEATYHKRSVEELLQRSSDTSDLVPSLMKSTPRAVRLIRICSFPIFSNIEQGPRLCREQKPWFELPIKAK
jgi:hypothetical protein